MAGLIEKKDLSGRLGEEVQPEDKYVLQLVLQRQEEEGQTLELTDFMLQML